MTGHPTPWSLKYTNFGESMGYDSKTIIVDANGTVIVRLGSGSYENRALEEYTATQIVEAVNTRNGL